MLKNLYLKAKNLLTRKEEGATMVEYALMVALIAMACIIAVTALGTSISSLFGEVGTSLDAVNGGS